MTFSSMSRHEEKCQYFKRTRFRASGLGFRASGLGFRAAGNYANSRKLSYRNEATELVAIDANPYILCQPKINCLVCEPFA